MTQRAGITPMTMSGHCAWPSTSEPEVSHAWCRREACACECHGAALYRHGVYVPPERNVPINPAGKDRAQQEEENHHG